MEATTLEKRPKKDKGKLKDKDNLILVGKKPAMTYVLSCVTQFGSHDEVRIQARGKAISKAVDVAEITRTRFVEDAKIADIQIGTEAITLDDGESMNVSSIEIVMKK